MWLVGVAIILVRGDVANQIKVVLFEVDLVTIMTGYLLISHGQAWSGLFAFGQGLLMDCYSAGLVGLFALLYMTAFLGISIGSRFFDPDSPRSMILLVTVAVLIKGLLFMVLLNAFSFETGFHPSSLLSIPLSAVISGILAPFVGQVFNQTDRFFQKKRKSEG